MKKYLKTTFGFFAAMVFMLNMSMPVYANNQTEETGLLSQIDNVEYVAEDGVEEVVITEVLVPMASMGSWSVANVALTMFTVLSSLAFIIKARKLLIVKFINILLSAMILVVFTATNITAGQMFFADQYTILHVVIAASNSALLYVATKYVLATQRI